MTNDWPDPALPGVPLNPEKDGWHWVSGDDGDPEPFYWNGTWQGSDQFSYYSFSESARYLGPCLTPADVDARIAEARRAALEEALQPLMEKKNDPAA